MNKIGCQLSVMMFLQFFIWGGWFVTLGTFLSSNLNATGSQIGMAFSTQSWGAIVAPFIIGLIADRFFNAEKILAILHLVGAALLFQMHSATDFSAFYPYVLGYMVVYMPTLALVNSVAFKQIDDPSKEFARIRVWGTIGWIAAGLCISYIFGWDARDSIDEGFLSNTFLLSSGAAFVLGIFSFTLPATPPAAQSQENITLRELIGADAVGLLKNRNFAVFFVSSILICIPLAFYYQNANPFLVELGVDNPTGKMTLGQVSEVGFMLLLPLFLHRFGIKLTLLCGMLAWVLRYVLFAFGNADEQLFMLIIGIVLHGICYDFFFVAGQIYTDSKAGARYRSSAQGMITLATYGLGMLIGFSVAGFITDFYTIMSTTASTAVQPHNWQSIWFFPAGFAAIVAVIFLIGFKRPQSFTVQKQTDVP